ncbi:C4b-binding protein alpha chain-like isoform X3 [Paralichthys olivaceus]|uniref:C4b-binding protein alpha chain-like isoform X3 n=1 Tax=Paralichthys olivaceus TaxID=8255 RepID=UPI0037530CAE
MDLTSVPVLLVLGLVVAAQAQNCTKPLGGPNMSLKGDDILLDAFPEGAKVSFACDVGYASAGGSSTITCTQGGWSLVRMKCERKECGSAGEVANGEIDYSEGTQFGDKVVITCNRGYNLVGARELVCGDKGWLNRLPTCEAITCQPPPMIQNGNFRPMEDHYTFSEVVNYACEKLYSLDGSKSSECSEDGRFKPDPPTCVMVTCDDPVIDNGFWAGGSRPPHGYKASVTFQCKPKYKLIGEQTQTCNINGKWSPGLPTCSLIIIDPKTTTTTAATTAATAATATTTTTTISTETESGGNSFKQYGLPILIIIVLIVLAGVIYWLCKRKQGSQRSFPDNEAAKHGEGIPLS